MSPDEPKTPSQQIVEDPNKRPSDAVVESQRAEQDAARARTVADQQSQVDRERAEAEARGAEELEKRRAWAEENTRGEQSGQELDHAGVMTRLIEWMRARGMLTHRELVEILGVGDVEIDHRHPDTEAPETREVTVNGVTRQQKIGKASVAEDSVAARHYVQELLRPGSTRPPDEQDEAA